MKLAIGNEVLVPVKFSVPDGGTKKSYSFTLKCKRLDTDDFQARIRDEKGQATNAKIRETILDIATGWTGQKFILEDDDTPAEFSEDALSFMLGVPGVLDLVGNSYVQESSAKAKN